jgi:hypothetical protein
MRPFAVSADDLELLSLLLVVGPLVGCMGCNLWVSTRLNMYRSMPSLSDLIPGGYGRPGGLAFVVWVWTSMHRQFNDRALSRAVIACRVWDILALVALMFAPYAAGLADRLAKHLSR